MTRIGIDVDCVLTELKPTMEFMAEYFNKPVARFDQIKDYNLSSAYGITEEESLIFWKEEEHKICKYSVPSTERIQSIFDNFVEDTSEIYVITSRNESLREVTENWLLDNNINYDVLIMTSGVCKKETIEELGLDIMIDDKPDLFWAMEDNLDTTMVCVDYEYNATVPSELRMSREGLIYQGNIERERVYG